MTTKIKAALSTVWADLKDTYNRIKVYLWGLLIILVYIKFNEIKGALLVYFSKKEIANDQAKDASLAKAEASDNSQADALVQKAQNEPNPGDDWNSK